MNVGHIIKVEEEGISGHRIQDSTVYMSKQRAVRLRNEMLTSILDENYAEMQQDTNNRVEIHLPSKAAETGYISVNGVWVVTATIEKVYLDEEDEEPAKC